MRLLATILIATTLAAMLPACSFAFVSGPPDNHAQLSYFDCTESRVVPVLDTILTALMVLNVITLSVEDDGDYAKGLCPSDNPMCTPPISRHGALAIDAVIGAAGAGGMVFGWTKTSACRRAKNEQALRQAPQQQPMPGSWPPPQGVPPAQGQPGQPGSWPPPAQGAPQPQPYPQPAPQPQLAPQPQH
ncbi:MAG: hypothetical protein JO257_23665 [Deltaproteobacteria bacterium]|nr:hypothetical protein [Deltaproteobacteria bacterium]